MGGEIGRSDFQSGPPPLCSMTPRTFDAGGATRRLDGWPRCAAGLINIRRTEQMRTRRSIATKSRITGRNAMPVVTWDHIHLRSPDPEATAAWFERMLGGEIVRGPGRIDVKLGGANVFIAPVTAGDGVGAPPATPYQGLDHFGLAVTEIDAMAAELEAKGVAFTKAPYTIRPGVRICFIRGPQGIAIELLERDPKYV
jgi:catechol 2,3-dioxygenase-like lactoylglutathione lyase family enzyme